MGTLSRFDGRVTLKLISRQINGRLSPGSDLYDLRQARRRGCSCRTNTSRTIQKPSKNVIGVVSILRHPSCKVFAVLHCTRMKTVVSYSNCSFKTVVNLRWIFPSIATQCFPHSCFRILNTDYFIYVSSHGE